MTEYIQSQLNILNKIFQNSIQKPNELAVQAVQPVQPTLQLKHPLFSHQQAVVNAMLEKTADLLSGKNNIYSRFAILGDPPNSGKTLDILSYLESLGPIKTPPQLNPESNEYFYNFEQPSQDISSSREINVILIPNYLQTQWEENIRKYTSTNFHTITNKKSITKFPASVGNILLINKMYKQFYKYCSDNNIKWKVLIIDEANTIYFQPNDEIFFNIAKFVWLVTPDWIPLIFKQTYFSYRDLNTALDPTQHCRDLVEYIKNKANTYYNWHLASSSYFRNILPFNNTNRTTLIVKCSEDFIQESMKPLLQNLNFNVTYKMCRPLVTIQNVHEFFTQVDDRIDNIMPTIYKDLNVKFISSNIPTQAELLEEDCAICLDTPKNPVKTTCCNHNYCAYCGLKNVIIRGSCPLCRAPINITNLAMYDNSGFNLSLERNGIKNKKEVCIKYLQDNSGENILIFSQHKNVYYNIYSEKITKLDDRQISQCMFLNNPNNVSGLKIDVQHIIFYSDFIDETVKNKVINLIELNRRTTRPIELLFLNDTFDLDSASSLLEL